MGKRVRKRVRKSAVEDKEEGEGRVRVVMSVRERETQEASICRRAERGGELFICGVCVKRSNAQPLQPLQRNSKRNLWFIK